VAHDKTIKTLTLKTDAGSLENYSTALPRVAVLGLVLENLAGGLETREIIGTGMSNREAINDAFRIASYLVNREVA